jgi:hypothetical protein
VLDECPRELRDRCGEGGDALCGRANVGATLRTGCKSGNWRSLIKNNTKENTWFDDGSYFKFAPMDNTKIERAAPMLSRHFLVLLHRSGLVSF